MRKGWTLKRQKLKGKERDISLTFLLCWIRTHRSSAICSFISCIFFFFPTIILFALVSSLFSVSLLHFADEDVHLQSNGRAWHLLYCLVANLQVCEAASLCPSQWQEAEWPVTRIIMFLCFFIFKIITKKVNKHIPYHVRELAGWASARTWANTMLDCPYYHIKTKKQVSFMPSAIRVQNGI